MDNGLYFLASDGCGDDCIMVLDANPEEDYENAFYDSWQQTHMVEEITAQPDCTNFFRTMLRWILDNKPQNGNYSEYELEYRLEEIVVREEAEAIKRHLFMRGKETIEEFLGYEISDEEKDVTENRLSEALDLMSYDEIHDAYHKYCKEN